MKPQIRLKHVASLNPVPWQKFFDWCGYESDHFEYELNNKYGAVCEWKNNDPICAEIEFTDEQSYLEFLIEWS